MGSKMEVAEEATPDMNCAWSMMIHKISYMSLLFISLLDVCGFLVPAYLQLFPKTKQNQSIIHEL